MGCYSSASVYAAFVRAVIEVDYAQSLCKNWAPQKEKLFVWLVMRNRCWTADRLQRGRLNYSPKCPLCDQVQECIDHLLVQCPSALGFWFRLWQRKGFTGLVPLTKTRLRAGGEK
jgi:hypothetical protein